MITESHIEIIKQVGANGQVSLGKKYAGKQIQVLTLIVVSLSLTTRCGFIIKTIMK